MRATIVHHIELSHTSPNISGGETSLIGIVRHLNQHSDIFQIIYTSESGRELYRKHLGEDGKNIDFVIIGSQKIEDINPYLAYYLRIFQLLVKLRKFPTEKDNIILSHEGFLPTLIYSLLLKKLNKHSRWLAIFHMRSPSIWKGFEGEYTGRYRLPSLAIIRYKFEEWLFFKFSSKELETLISVNPSYEDFLRRIYKNVYVLKVFGGENIPATEDVSVKKFDLVFMARFHEQKGLFELVDILTRIKGKKPDISLALLGGGAAPAEAKFFKMIKECKLAGNIKYFGFITGAEKFDILRTAKIFMFPSFYESYPQAVLEAMKCGLPVVAYDLPPFWVFKQGMIKVPILDNQAMMAEILKLLDDADYYEKVKQEALEFSGNFSWDKTGEEIYQLITKIV